MTHTPITFNEPAVAPNQVRHIEAAIASGKTASGGSFAAKVCDFLRAETGSEGVLTTTSCTAALEMSAMLLDVGPGDTVIVPSFTFTTSALAFASRGARLLFCDIEPETLGPDPKHVAELLDDSVKAVVLVHYAGIACDVAGIREALQGRPDVAIVEDNAHGLFGRWHGQPLGSLGRFSTLSFHETKNIVCGEGGALILNRADDVDRAQILYDKGTDRQAFFQGRVDKYSWRDTGSSFGMSDVLAAYLWAQLEHAEQIQARRRAVFTTYAEGLAPVAGELGLRLPVVPDQVVPAWHLFYVLLPDAQRRPAVMADLTEQQIATTFHYVPLHDSIGGKRFAERPTDCPVTTDVSSRLVRLPFHVNLSDGDLDRVLDRFVDAVRRLG